MLIYGECPHCGSTDTHTFDGDVDEWSVPPLMFDVRHCDACGRDYRDVYQLIGRDEDATC